MKTIMANFIQWLYHKRAIHLLLVVSYFLLVVLPHEQVGLLVVHIFKGYTRDAYNFAILIIGLIGLAIYFVPVLKNIYKGQDKPLKLFYLLTTLIFVVIVFNVLVVVNVEIIHFLQYGLMAILLFPLTQRYGETLFWATLLGAIDEAYQYLYLAPDRTQYYDFNDVIINLLGAALGLVFLRSMDLGQIGVKRQRWIWTIPTFTIGIITMLVFILWKIGILFVYPPIEELTNIILLVKKVPTGFWSIDPYATFHIVEPLEGIVILTLLFCFYSGLGKTLENKKILSSNLNTK